MYSCAIVLANSAATLGLVESQEISTIRLTADDLKLTDDDPIACSTETGARSFRCSTFRHPETGWASMLSRDLSFWFIFLTTRCNTDLLCISRICVWMSIEG